MDGYHYYPYDEIKFVAISREYWVLHDLGNSEYKKRKVV